MATRVPASQRTREELTSLIEGRLSTSSAKDELVKLATRLIVEEALEGEAGDAVGRDYYEHGAQPGQGQRNGYRTGRLKTAEGFDGIFRAADCRPRRALPLSDPRAPQGSHRRGSRIWRSRCWRVGLSVRDIEDAFKDESGRLLLSRTTVSQLGGGCRRSCQDFAKRELSKYRDHLSVRRWHCRMAAAWRQARAGSGGLGLHGERRPCPAASDGGIEGRYRDGDSRSSRT